MSLAHPLLLLSLVPILAAAALARLGPPASARLPGSWPALVEPALRGALTAGGTAPRRGRLALCLAIAVLLALALARPAFDRGGAAFANIGGRVIVMDLRPGAAVAEQRQLVERLLDGAPEVPTAIVAAAADAHGIVPLTVDRRQIRRYLNVLEPGVMPVPGRALHLGIAQAEALLARAGVAVRQIVVVSDGAPPQAAVPIASSETMRAVAVPDPDGWSGFADTYDASLATAAELPELAASLRREIARTLRTEADAGALDLTPLVIAAAMLLWLGLFRRRADT